MKLFISNLILLLSLSTSFAASTIDPKTILKEIDDKMNVMDGDLVLEIMDHQDQETSDFQKKVVYRRDREDKAQICYNDPNGDDDKFSCDLVIVDKVTAENQKIYSIITKKGRSQVDYTKFVGDVSLASRLSENYGVVAIKNLGHNEVELTLNAKFSNAINPSVKLVIYEDGPRITHLPIRMQIQTQTDVVRNLKGTIISDMVLIGVKKSTAILVGFSHVSNEKSELEYDFGIPNAFRDQLSDNFFTEAAVR